VKRVGRLSSAFVAMLLISASGSASPPKPIAGMSGKTVMLVRRPTPDFMYLTGGAALSGAVAAVLPPHDTAGPASESKAAGAAVLADAKVEDPTVRVGDILFADLVSTYGLTAVASGPETVANGSELEKLRKQGRSDLIFEYYTENWRTFYFLFDFTHLDIWYYGKARLIDTHTAKSIRQESCARKPKLSPSTPTQEELLADHGVKLRQAVSAVEELCIQTVRDAFGLQQPEGDHRSQSN
jgi:hypothetical protein